MTQTMDPGAGGNSGTMIVDATCAPSHIRYPQDVSLLNEARENAEKLLDVPSTTRPTARSPAPTASAPGKDYSEVHKMPQTHRENDPQSHWESS